MLSVNIPVFNTEVGDLVKEIANQARALAISFEIKVYDDGSQERVQQQNRKLKEIAHVKYRELEQNIGRAAIRNKMGFESEKKFLLFIDADSKIVSEKYLENYLRLAKPGIVLCGGTCYSPEKPADHKKLLRWVYGSRREAISAEKRNNHKGFIITSNNFLIDREIFNQVHFRKNLGNYGHEDTLLGYDLFAKGVIPQHIHNPVEHTGLEDSYLFVEKTREALKNLHYISTELLNNSPVFAEQVNFLKKYHRIIKIIPPVVLQMFFNQFEQKMEQNLTGKNPRMFWFDVYKLGFYAKLKHYLP
jgi:glycosyltransferase involved in cell wall biosynthesis